MGKQLIIVESPAKVKTIKKFLGSGYLVEASVGHVRDLPSKTLGVDEENGFNPQYVIIDNKRNIVNGLRSAAAKADIVYLAPDPDREGEAIAWHVAELIKDKAKEIKRIQFNEITERAVKDAIAHPRELDENLFDAQQARRILDRLVGYKISPLLWKTVKQGISAGRVQSVALRLIVEREEERENFAPVEYWLFQALLEGSAPPPFKADLVKVKGKKANIANAEQADKLEKYLLEQIFKVRAIEQKERIKNPLPPFITSTLQQAANQRYGYSAKRTMQIAQKLYEGVDLGKKGLTALITYMRTDSTRIAEEAQKACKKFIETELGKPYLPAKTRIYKSKTNAQDAHEAIRPVDVSIRPEDVQDLLAPEQFNLYRIIWQRFVASQMAAARFHDTQIIIDAGNTQWQVKGEKLLFDGYLKVMPKSASENDNLLPDVRPGEELRLKKLDKEQKFTQPPAQYSEATLVKKLEDLGIGRPSTYAAIISTLQDREYITIQEKKIIPTDLGRVVCRQLVENFASLMDVGFTAQMEEGLDKIADGNEKWKELLCEFAADFNPTLEAAHKNMQNVKTGVPAGLDCPLCQKPLYIKFGKSGPFLACSGYPGCKYTSNFQRQSDGSIEAVQKQKLQQEVVGKCPDCGKNLVVKTSRTGSRFIACTGFPDCHYARSISTGIKCPACGQGELVEKSTRKGKQFYSCNRYPACEFATWGKPVPKQCLQCGSPFLVEKKTRSGIVISCPKKGCGYRENSPDTPASIIPEES